MAPRGHRRSVVPGWLRGVAGLLIAFAIIDYLVLPRLAGAEKSLHLLAEIRPGWVVAGVVFEAASLVCYLLFTRSLLRDRGVSFSRMLRSDLTGFGVSHVVPGGGAGATALRFRLLVTSGATATQVTAAIAAEGVGTWLALALVLWVTLIPAIFVLGASSLLLTLFLVGAVIVVCGAAAVRERSRLAKPAARLLQFALRRFPARVRPWLAGVAVRLRGLVSDPARWRPLCRSPPAGSALSRAC